MVVAEARLRPLPQGEAVNFYVRLAAFGKPLGMDDVVSITQSQKSRGNGALPRFLCLVEMVVIETTSENPLQ